MEERLLQKKIKQMEQESVDYRQTMRALNRTIKEQNKMLRDQNKKIIGLLEQNKIVLNKDVLTFEQAFKQKCAEKQIISYLADFLGSAPTWNNLTNENLSAFQKWLKNAPKKRGEGVVSDSSAALYMVKLKSVIKFGYANRNDVSFALKHERTAKSKKVWLRPNDLRMILEYSPTSLTERLARKLFLICAITGARKSDAQYLKVENIDGNTLRYIPIKTREKECFVSLSDEAKEVLIELLSEQIDGVGDSSRYIGEVCRNSGLNRKFDIGTPGKENIVEIWEAISMHSARHSFATNKYRYSGWTERQIADAIGHTSFDQTFETYVIDKSPVSNKEGFENSDEVFA